MFWKNKKEEDIPKVDFSKYFAYPPPLKEKDRHAYFGIEFIISKAKEAKRHSVKVDIALLKETVIFINEYIDELEKYVDDSIITEDISKPIVRETLI